jgi:hypothetical protein
VHGFSCRLAHRAEPEVRVSEKSTRFPALNDAPLKGSGL